MREQRHVVYRYGDPTPDELPLPTGLARTRLDASLVHALFGREQRDRNRLRSYLQLLSRGCIGFVVHDKSSWVAVQWLTTPDSKGPRNLPPGIALGLYWCLNEHTREPYRRKGIWSSLKVSGIRYVREASGDDRHPLFSDTLETNQASRLAHEKLGFVPAGVVNKRSIRIPRIANIVVGSWDKQARHTFNKGNGSSS